MGLLLALLVGPLIVALIQASLEQGTKAGLFVALGIWISDFLYIIGVYLGMTYVNELIQWPHFELVVGLVGSLVLLGAGIGTIVTKPPKLDGSEEGLQGAKGAIPLLTKGFLINTINPVTVFFWMSIMTGVVLENNYSHGQSTIFFGGLLGTIITTDTLKVLLAKKIRHRLTQKHLWWVRKIAGIALIVFAFALAIKVMI